MLDDRSRRCAKPPDGRGAFKAGSRPDQPFAVESHRDDDVGRTRRWHGQAGPSPAARDEHRGVRRRSLPLPQAALPLQPAPLHHFGAALGLEGPTLPVEGAALPLRTPSMPLFSPTVVAGRGNVAPSRADVAAFGGKPAPRRAMYAPFWCIAAGPRGNAAGRRGIDAAFFAIAAGERADAAPRRAGVAAFFAIAAPWKAIPPRPPRGAFGVAGGRTGGEAAPPRQCASTKQDGPGCVGNRGRGGVKIPPPGGGGGWRQLWVVVVSPFARDLANRLDSSPRRPSRPWLRPDTFSRA